MMGRVEGEVGIDIRKAVVSTALQNLNAVSDEPMASHNSTIFRVPAYVRQRNKHLYEPQTVAIGPYRLRDDEPSSLQAMEWLKWRYLHKFLFRNRNIIIEDYVAEIQELEPRARRCYFEPVELSTEKFVEMLLLDGCFILEFIIKWKLRDNDSMCTGEWSLPLVHGDLLLLKNQIPLFVLDKLFELVKSTLDSEIPSSLMELLVDYLTFMSIESPEEETTSSKNGNQANRGPGANEPPREAKNFHHLLHPCYDCCVKKPQTDPGVNEPREAKNFQHLLHLYYDCNVKIPQSDPGVNEPREAENFHHLLHLCYDCNVPQTGPTGRDMKRSRRTIPSATELLEAGVGITKKKKKKEKNRNQNQNQKSLSSFLDVTFSGGVLEIPFLWVENSTLPRLSNLVAFEQCGGCKRQKAYVTSYAVFMDCLINTREDVAILHERGILENKLASDEELVLFFNQLSDWATLDYDDHYLAGLFRDVGEYCDSTWPKWRAALVREYFKSPWAIISVIAAAVVLILTFLQTVYAIYTYYHPRN